MDGEGGCPWWNSRRHGGSAGGGCRGGGRGIVVLFSGGARGKGGDEVIVVQGNEAAAAWRLLAGGCPRRHQGGCSPGTWRRHALAAPVLWCCAGIAAAPRRDATSTELLLAFVSLSCPDSDIEHRGFARGSSLLVACSRRPFEQSAGINIILQTPDSSHHPRLRAHRGISHVRETSSSVSLSSAPSAPSYL